jgi:hypothetical protein
MAAKPPGDFGSNLPAPNTSELLKSPSERLAPPPSYTSNGTYGRLCTLNPKPQQYLSQGPTREEEQRRREEQRKQMNTLGLWFGGVATGGGALMRLLGAPESAVESAAEAGWNWQSPAPGAPGTSVARKYW